MISVRFRDLSLTKIDHERCLVVACDAAGSIGEKEADVEPAAAESVGYFSTRVVVLELLSVRAEPMILACTAGVERQPTGHRLLTGVRRQLRDAELTERVLVIDSFENNFRARQTSLGVTLVGITRLDVLPGTDIQPGDELYQIGEPKVGSRATIDDRSMPSPSTIRQLTSTPGVREVIPLGSRGVLGELEQLGVRGISALPVSEVSLIALQRSAGPATALLVLTSPRTSTGNPWGLHEPVQLVAQVESVHAVDPFPW